MKSYKEFCDHYEYALDDKKSKKLYKKYKTNLAIFQSIMEKKIDSDDDDNDDGKLIFS